MNAKVVRIGGASAGWGDSVTGPRQLVERAAVDYLSFDFLAEMTMSILARAYAKDKSAGWATDFVTQHMRAILPKVVEKRIKILTNAGGVNPRGCAAALHGLAEEFGVSLRIAVIEGDDCSAILRDAPTTCAGFAGSGEPPKQFLSANAYLGAFPIASALERGADVVITGRCADSALPLGALIHEFGWAPEDFDLLAAGSLAGHILECGAQGAGGLHTDWQRVPGWEDIGYPIVECRADGVFVVAKPAGAGGLVEPPVVAEQILYEIGDPAAYELPDVICDFTEVSLKQVGLDRVEVSSAKGRAPSDQYKVSVTYQDKWRAVVTLILVGRDAVGKAQRTAEALLARSRRLFAEQRLADFARAHFEAIGAEWSYGANSRAAASREVMMRLVVDHEDPRALEIMGREIASSAVSWAPGTTGVGPRPPVSPIIRLYSCLVPKALAPASVTLDDETWHVAARTGFARASVTSRSLASSERAPAADDVEVRLGDVAWARSGDKGDIANVGVIARSAAIYEVLKERLTGEVVAEYMRHFVKGEVVRYAAPGIMGLNFVMREALEGGGMASPRIDPLAKAFAQIVLDLPLLVPAHMVRGLAVH